VFRLAAARQTGRTQADAEKARDLAASLLTPEDLSKAQQACGKVVSPLLSRAPTAALRDSRVPEDIRELVVAVSMSDYFAAAVCSRIFGERTHARYFTSVDGGNNPSENAGRGLVKTNRAMEMRLQKPARQDDSGVQFIL